MGWGLLNLPLSFELHQKSGVLTLDDLHIDRTNFTLQGQKPYRIIYYIIFATLVRFLLRATSYGLPRDIES
jgi:hypothetical protein